MNRYICISLFIVGIMGFYSVAFAENCNLTVKCICESNSLRVVQCPNFMNEAIDCNKVGIPQGTCAVDCGQEVAASCDEIPIECRNNETANCIVTLPIEVETSIISCPSGLTKCLGQCVDLSSNEANCGECGNTCTMEQTCVSASCESSVCSPGQTDCSGQCVNLNNDDANCGVCGNPCATGEVCVAATCAASSCFSDADCISGQYCDQSNQCVNKNNLGFSCSQQNECASGYCVDGYCCDTACDSACDSCNFGGNVGSCTINAAGTQGSPTCDPYLCNGIGATCPNTCTTDADCVSSHYCSGNVCVERIL